MSTSSTNPSLIQQAGSYSRTSARQPLLQNCKLASSHSEQLHGGESVLLFALY